MSNQEILLEAGTNEIEILEFFLGKQSFGINVLKIKQILKYDESILVPLPNSYHSVKGSFLFQSNSTLIIDLNAHLNLPPPEFPNLRSIVLVCEFNDSTIAFLIDGVDKIHRMSWQAIQAPPKLGRNDQDNVTGILNLNGRQILMLDFEQIAQVAGGESGSFNSLPELLAEDKKVKRENIKLLIADDSRMIRLALEEHLAEANYTGLTIFDNGVDVFNFVMKIKEQAEREEKQVTDYLIIVITDIEMPGMDGLTLCRKIKEETPEVLVLILSSLINEQLAFRCQEVGADAYLSKKEINQLAASIDKLCL
ncbi:MAG: chemotaxis protein CheV [SAR324 cluster bacterium]|nr:chemotaxis protein CheV [SAR324 cluster bacterium]